MERIRGYPGKFIITDEDLDKSGEILVNALVAYSGRKEYEGKPVSPDGPFDVSPLAEKQFVGFVVQHDKTGGFLDARSGLFLFWHVSPFDGTIFHSDEQARDRLDYYEANNITGKDFRLEVTIKKVTLIV